MEMNKKLAVLLVAGMLLATSASAWYLIWHRAVMNCEDTDGGANYREQGTMTVLYLDNRTVRTFIDHCVDDNTVAEFVCSDDVTGRPCDHANKIVQNCKLALGNPDAYCLVGRCVV